MSSLVPSSSCFLYLAVYFVNIYKKKKKKGTILTGRVGRQPQRRRYMYFLADGLGDGRAGICDPCDLAEDLVGIGVRVDASIAESLDRRFRGLGWGLN